MLLILEYFETKVNVDKLIHILTILITMLTVETCENLPTIIKKKKKGFNWNNLVKLKGTLSLTQEQ